MALDTIAIQKDILRQVTENKIVAEADIILSCTVKYQESDTKNISAILENLIRLEKLDRLHCKETDRYYYISCQGRPIPKAQIEKAEEYLKKCEPLAKRLYCQEPSTKVDGVFGS